MLGESRALRIMRDELTFEERKEEEKRKRHWECLISIPALTCDCQFFFGVSQDTKFPMFEGLSCHGQRFGKTPDTLSTLRSKHQ